MPTTPIYDDLLAQVTDKLERRILDILLQAYPETSAGITRHQLVLALFGYWPNDLANDTNDRIIRKAIERLQKEWPIISSSGRAGYKLSEDRAEIEAYAAEQASRAARETEKARQAHAWPAKIRTISEYRKTGKEATQSRLI